MKNKPCVLHLKVQIKGTDYILGSLSIKPHKNEMSYHFLFPKGSPEEHLHINQEKITGRLEHVTWHQRVINLKTLKIGSFKPVYQKKPIDENFLPDEPKVKPILLESFSLNGVSSHLAGNSNNLKWARSADDELWLANLPEQTDFSLAFFLIPKKWKEDYCFIAPHSSKEKQVLLFAFNQVFYNMRRVSAFDEWDLLVCIGPYTQHLSFHDERLSRQRRLVNFDSPGSGINRLLYNIMHSSLASLLRGYLENQISSKSTFNPKHE